MATTHTLGPHLPLCGSVATSNLVSRSSDDGVQHCVPVASCSLPNALVQVSPKAVEIAMQWADLRQQLLTGQSSCVCARGYISNLSGGVRRSHCLHGLELISIWISSKCINACLV